MAGSIYARGVNKIVVMAEEAVAFGTIGAGPGQVLRRTAINLTLNASGIESQEILPSQQVRDMRLGPRQVSGTVNGQLSPISYKMFFEGLLRARFAAGVSVAGVTDSSVVADNGTYQVISGTPFGMIDLTSTATNWKTTGFRVGDVIRPSGLTNLTDFNSPSGTFNQSNLTIVGFNPNGNVAVLNGGLPAWTSGSQASVNFAVPGKKIIMPATGQLPLSYTFEEWYSDISVSQIFTGCRVTQISLTIPASGFVTFSASVTGQNMVQQASQNYGAPTAVNTETSLTAVGGMITFNGVPLAYITSLNLQIQADVQADPVVGSQYIPDIFQGTNSVRGSFTCFMANDIIQNDFLNEVEVQLGFVLSASSLANQGDFISIYMSRVKLSSSTKTDNDKAISRSFNFMALEQVTNPGGVYDATTISIIDSAA